MKRNLFCFSLLFLIIQIFSNLSKEKREKFLKKYTKEISIDFLEEDSEINLGLNLNGINIDYDFNKINEVISNNNFPYSYNFFNKEGVNKIIKDQGNCGSCWTFATSTTLSYRFNKKGKKDLNLSPQYALSCLVGECRGVNQIDAEINLVKNGTVNESCFGYSSVDGTVLKCPKKCEKNGNFHKYYAKNAYILDNYSNKNFYEIVALIIDQLITEGPVSSSIPVYDDFMNLLIDKNCANDNFIYKYDGKSPYSGEHMVVIVGYGYINNRFYWLVQNSWGKNFCNDGLVKIEFGQIQIELISFTYPYINNTQPNPNPITINFDSLNKNQLCELKIKATESNVNKWFDSLEITFEHIKGYDRLNFQCSVNNIINKGNIINCYFGFENKYKKEGIYKYKEHLSIKNENIFNLIGFDNKEFYFYGPQFLDPFIDIDKYPEENDKSYYYISEKGSLILFNDQKMEDNSPIPKIYANEDSQKPLKNCKRETIINDYLKKRHLVKCIIDSSEIKYFNKDYNLIQNSILCGGHNRPTNVYVYKLNKKKNPVFRVKKFVSGLDDYSNFIKYTYILAKVEGSLSDYIKNNSNSFAVLVELQLINYVFSEFITKQMNCSDLNPIKTGIEYSIRCKIDVKGLDIKTIYVLPYYWITINQSPFEIILNKKYKLDSSSYIKFYFSFILFSLLLF